MNWEIIRTAAVLTKVEATLGHRKPVEINLTRIDGGLVGLRKWEQQSATKDFRVSASQTVYVYENGFTASGSSPQRGA